MSEAREILENYLRRIGLSRPADIAQQVQITLLRQWTEHLDQVLADERVPGDLRIRIVRAVIYGGTPTLAEAEIRDELTAEMVKLAERGVFPKEVPR